MKKFLIIERDNKLGFISSNLRTSIWGIVPKAERESLISSLQADYGGNISISFPRNLQDDLDSREQIAYLKLSHYMNNEKLKQILILKDLQKKGER